MNLKFRRHAVGILSGALASTVLLATLHYGVWSSILGVAIGAAYSAAFRPARQAYADSLMAGGSLGVPLWGLINVIAVPLLSGQMPEWSAEQMRQHFPALVGWVVYGASLGIINQALQDGAEHVFGAEPAPKVSAVSVSKRIVILGGGFAGMRTAECLEEKLRGDFSITLTLVNDTNALLFTPMLAEVAGSSLEASHISTPLRSTLRRTEFIRGTVTDVDLEKRLVILRSDVGADGAPAPREVPYDQLVFALGSISNYLGMTNIQKFAFNFKSLLDAIRIRNHVIEMFERADLVSDPAYLCRCRRRFCGSGACRRSERFRPRHFGGLSQDPCTGVEYCSCSFPGSRLAGTERVFSPICAREDAIAWSTLPLEHTHHGRASWHGPSQ